MINHNDDNVMHGNAWFEYFCGSVRTHDIWEGNVITKNNIQAQNILLLGSPDTREGVTLRRLILQSLRVYFESERKGRRKARES